MRPDYAGCDGVAPGVIQGGGPYKLIKGLLAYRPMSYLFLLQALQASLRAPAKTRDQRQCLWPFVGLWVVLDSNQ
jgi:hypothetical protein